MPSPEALRIARQVAGELGYPIKGADVAMQAKASVAAILHKLPSKLLGDRRLQIFREDALQLRAHAAYIDGEQTAKELSVIATTYGLFRDPADKAAVQEIISQAVTPPIVNTENTEIEVKAKPQAPILKAKPQPAKPTAAKTTNGTNGSHGTKPTGDFPGDRPLPPIADIPESVSDGPGRDDAADANGRADDSEHDNGRKEQTAIHATPYVFKDPSKLPLRQYLYGKVLIRKFVSVIIGHTGIGKTTLSVAETLAQVSGKALLGIPVPKPLRVWLWNLEDPQDETERKIGAGMLHYGLTAEDIGDRLFTDSGRDQPLVTAEMTRTGATIVRPVIDGLVDEMRKRKIDIIKIDPYVSSHTVPENDNGAMDMIVKEWGRVGDRTNSGVELSMHPRKSNGTEVTAEDARGASSTVNGTRVKRALNRMTPAEANQAGVQNHRLYFRTLPDTSLAPPVDKSDWYKLVSVDLGNGPNGGDSVGVVTKWEWPDHLAGLTASDFEKVAAVIRRDKWRQSPQASKWVGNAVAEALDLNADNKAEKAKISAMLKLWLEAGSLVEVESLDESRQMRKFIEVTEDA
jgi:AAA domain